MYSTRTDFTFVETDFLNTNSFSKQYSCVTGDNGSAGDSSDTIKIWADGVINKIVFSLNNQNRNSNFLQTKTPNLIIYTYN